MTLISAEDLEPGWYAVLQNVLAEPEIGGLEQFLQSQLVQGIEILPISAQWFNAFRYTTFDAVKAVILGQDPYPTPGHAHGLCFSVEDNVTPLPKSLKNIFRELEDDLGVEVDAAQTGNLAGWAEQGVLLLNTVLTVEAGNAGSHRGQGWERITDQAIQALNQSEQPRVFILWGADARKKGQYLDRDRHLVIESPHPSPLSAYRGFYGSKPFSRSNEFLRSQGLKEIDWTAF